MSIIIIIQLALHQRRNKQQLKNRHRTLLLLTDNTSLIQLGECNRSSSSSALVLLFADVKKTVIIISKGAWMFPQIAQVRRR